MTCFPQWIPPGRVISLVGGGGKTTFMYHLASQQAALGKKVLVTTTTKIFFPKEVYCASTIEEADVLWKQGSFAVIGTPILSGKKLSFPPLDLWNPLLSQADLVLIEADGAKHHPIKVPRDGEPVLHPQSDGVLAVMGLSAIGKPLQECCFGWEQACWLLNAEPGHLLTEEDAASILSSSQGSRKAVANRSFSVLLNQCDDFQRHASAQKISALLQQQGVEQPYFSSFSQEERNHYQRISQK